LLRHAISNLVENAIKYSHAGGTVEVALNVATNGKRVVAITDHGIGIPKDSVLRYETAIKADKFMLIVHGGAQEIKRAHELLMTSGLASFDHHEGTVSTRSAVHS
jgi:two-component sensor histidine kinase